jgi:hypothetical protein
MDTYECPECGAELDLDGECPECLWLEEDDWGLEDEGDEFGD